MFAKIWNVVFRFIIFWIFYPEAILYPALDPNNLNVGMNPKSMFLWKEQEITGWFILFWVLVTILLYSYQHCTDGKHVCMHVYVYMYVCV